MNILAIDYGRKNIGLAWCQTGVDLILPYGVVKNDEAQVISELDKMIKSEGIDLVVVGLPIGLDGEENKNTATIREFGKDLSKTSGVKVEFVDERFTSQQADNTMGDVSRDEKSAMIILESYLGQKG
ncbi:Holliday junction resolvase RuvX [Candidatus Nomurabacteria bacterium]|nr:Holliday junction resolvase RuvX [Candidatus Nomurabacteria bacterium]